MFVAQRGFACAVAIAVLIFDAAAVAQETGKETARQRGMTVCAIE